MAEEDNTERRFIPPGSCTWCGHPLHGDTCTKTIRTGRGTSSSCPCSRARWEAARRG